MGAGETPRVMGAVVTRHNGHCESEGDLPERRPEAPCSTSPAWRTSYNGQRYPHQNSLPSRTVKAVPKGG